MGCWGSFIWNITRFYEHAHRSIGFDGGMPLHDPSAVMMFLQAEILSLWRESEERGCFAEPFDPFGPLGRQERQANQPSINELGHSSAAVAVSVRQFSVWFA